MIAVDIKALIGRLNPYCTNSLEAAAGQCVSRTHYEVTVEHVLSKLLQDPQSDIPMILRHFEIDGSRIQAALAQTLEKFKTGNTAKPVFSPLLLKWLQEAWLTGSVDLGENKVRSGALMAAFINRSGRFASDRYVDLLDAVSRDVVMSRFWDILKNSIEQTTDRTRPEETQMAADGTSLGRFCVDFTQKSGAGEIDPVFGRDQEIRQIIDILARRRKNNPIVVGEAGVGKTAVVEGLALRVKEGDVPDLLRDVSILGLDMGLLQAGAGMRGEFENRLKSVINEIKASEKPIILFIDEAHTLIGAGGAAGGSDAANLLKPALARGELRTVAATTWSEYKKYFEKDAALARRFQLVKLDEPSVDTTVLILRGLKEKYEAAHHVVVRDDAIQAAAALSSRYMSGRQLPDKAVDLLDTCAARVKVLLTAKPDVIEDIERRIQALEREKIALEREILHGTAIAPNRLQEIDLTLAQLKAALRALTERWQKEQRLAKNLIDLRTSLFELINDSTSQPEKETELRKQIKQTMDELEAVQGDSPLVRFEVDPDVISKVVSDWTGIPLGKVMRDDALNVIRLEENLKNRVKEQDGALNIIARVIQSAKAGIKDPAQPMGVFLLVGPSGVGKTETGLAVADLLFGGEQFLVTVNMSEFQEKHTVSRLIGSPPGYVGYGEGGVLTEAVRQRPYSVVLLDEAEKAHLEVLNLFYQVFDKGMLADGEGRDIDFKNTVIFLTSNLATDVIMDYCACDDQHSAEALNTAIRPILSRHFKPALLARMTVVPYLTLSPVILKEIVVLKLEKLVKRLEETHKLKLTYSADVIDQIVARCTEVETGARNIDYIVSGSILPRMSQEILARMGEGDLPPEVKFGLAEDGSFTIEFT